MLKPGEFVICVDAAPRMSWSHDGGRVSSGNLDSLRQGTVYTVRDCFTEPSGASAIRVVEIVRPAFKGMEPGFRACRFRSVEEDGLSIFRKALAYRPTEMLEALR